MWLRPMATSCTVNATWASASIDCPALTGFTRVAHCPTARTPPLVVAGFPTSKGLSADADLAIPGFTEGGGGC